MLIKILMHAMGWHMSTSIQNPGEYYNNQILFPCQCFLLFLSLIALFLSQMHSHNHTPVTLIKKES